MTRAFTSIDRWHGGGGWIAHPDEFLRRASHVVSENGKVWVIEPIDAPGLDAFLRKFGEVAGVVVLINRHSRDAETLAARHDVAIHAPPWVTRSYGVERVTIDDTLGTTEYRVHNVLDLPLWREGALYDGTTLIVCDTLGTAPHFVSPNERLGLHITLRAWRPSSLATFSPTRLLVGHGSGIMTNAEDAIGDALAGARRHLPGAMLNGGRNLARTIATRGLPGV